MSEVYLVISTLFMDLHQYKNYLIHTMLLVLFFVSGYFLINHYFEKKIQLRSFEECLSVVSDPMANWMTRKGTIDYCKGEAL